MGEKSNYSLFLIITIYFFNEIGIQYLAQRKEKRVNPKAVSSWRKIRKTKKKKTCCRYLAVTLLVDQSGEEK